MLLRRAMVASLLPLAACASGGPTDGGDPGEVVAARILPSPLPNLMIGQTVQLRLETRTRSGGQYQATTASWTLTEGSGTITSTGVLAAARSGTVTGDLLGARAEARFTVLPFPEFHPATGAWRVTRWIRTATPGGESFDLLLGGYQAVTLAMAPVDQGLAWGRVQADGTDPRGGAQRSRGTVIAVHPDRLSILLLPDAGSQFPLALEEAWVRWELQGNTLRLIQTDATSSWRFPSGLVRNTQDLIELAR